MSNILRNIAAITVDQYQYRESSFGLIKEGGAVYEILEHGGASTFLPSTTHARRQAGTTRASVVRQDTCLHVLFNVQCAQKGLPCFLNESNWKPRRPHSNHFSQKLKTIKACSCRFFFFNTNDLTIGWIVNNHFNIYSMFNLIFYIYFVCIYHYIYVYFYLTPL